MENLGCWKTQRPKLANTKNRQVRCYVSFQCLVRTEHRELIRTVNNTTITISAVDVSILTKPTRQQIHEVQRPVADYRLAVVQTSIITSKHSGHKLIKSKMSAPTLLPDSNNIKLLACLRLCCLLRNSEGTQFYNK